MQGTGSPAAPNTCPSCVSDAAYNKCYGARYRVGCLISKDLAAQVRAGTGGDEAGLWVADLLRMYQRYSDGQRWKTNIISENPAEAGGFKEVVVQVRTVARCLLQIYPIHPHANSSMA